MTDAVYIAAIAALPGLLAWWDNRRSNKHVADKVDTTIEKVEIVNDYVQGNFHAEVAKGVALQEKLDVQSAGELAKSEAREGAVVPPKGEQP